MNWVNASWTCSIHTLNISNYLRQKKYFRANKLCTNILHFLEAKLKVLIETGKKRFGVAFRRGLSLTPLTASKYSDKGYILQLVMAILYVQEIVTHFI